MTSPRLNLLIPAALRLRAEAAGIANLSAWVRDALEQHCDQADAAAVLCVPAPRRTGHWALPDQVIRIPLAATTAHPGSHYGQPVLLLPGGDVLDALTLAGLPGAWVEAADPGRIRGLLFLAEGDPTVRTAP